MALLAAVLWTWASWPLPREAFRGIPSSSQNVERDHVRRMIPGDHLQFLYQLWLGADMLAGRTPWFHNVYEFNTGADAERRSPSVYFFPFFVLFALGQAAGGTAFGYNLMTLLATVGAGGFLWALARRFTDRPAAAAAAAAVGLLLPSYWAAVLGGSPIGVAMLWVPAVLFGIDALVRDGRWGGAALAGIALNGLSWTDTHALFFALLAAPAWALWLTLFPPGPAWRSAAFWRQRLLAALPLIVLALLALGFNAYRHRHLPQTVIAGGREWDEIAKFSPSWEGFFQHGAFGARNHVYLGIPLVAALFACGVAAWARARRAPPARRAALALTLLLAAGAGIALLALGTRGPGDGLLLRAARKLIPPYQSIRQPFKIYALMPSLVAVALSLGFEAFRRRPSAAPALPVGRRRLAVLLGALAIVGVAWDLWSQGRCTVCRLDDSQGAYAAVAADAASAGRLPRALVVPLWPGDSTWTSLAQYYVSRYRIRMINGYRPAVPLAYVDGVYREFASVNQGALSDSQLDDLWARGIRHVVVHEDAFPEQVSPFPVGVTLQRLLDHPRLEFLSQDGSVWAFRIRAAAAPRAPSPTLCPAWFPSRRRQAEDALSEGARGLRAEDDSASGGAFVRLYPGSAEPKVDVRSIAGAADLAWSLRVRGSGILGVRTLAERRTLGKSETEVRFDDWRWIRVLVPPFCGRAALAAELKSVSGRVEVDELQLVAGAWTPPAIGETRRLPASCFFHAGSTDRDCRSVRLRADRDPAGIVFYGPKLPFEPGRYLVELDLGSAAPEGTRLGWFNWRQRDGDESGRVDVWAGRPARAEVVQPDNRPAMAVFVFERAADLEIRAVTIKRLE